MQLLRLIGQSALLGIGLAMDAFSVSMADGLNEPSMKPRKMLAVAGTFSFFQGLMPMLGWVCVHYAVQTFREIERWIPWIALALLAFIGGKMLIEGIRSRNEEKSAETWKGLGFSTLLVQGIATSIDALSVGFTIEGYQPKEALLAALIIAAITLIVCIGGILIGKRFGTGLAGKASIFGGAILIAIGIEIFLSGILG